MYKNDISNYIEKLQTTLGSLNIEDIDVCINELMKAYTNNNNIFICGNGGSASTASHFACDLNKGVSYGLEQKFKIIPLTDSLSTITAYTNDLSYDIIFVEQLKNFFKKGDILIGISGSGNSQNVLNAIEYVNENNGVTIGCTGCDGGKLKGLAQHSINANINDMQISEDVHMILVHIIMKTLSTKLGSPNC